jgi:hypothetical protein
LTPNSIFNPNLQTVIEGLNISRNAVLGNVSATGLEENTDVMQKTMDYYF